MKEHTQSVSCPSNRGADVIDRIRAFRLSDFGETVPLDSPFPTPAVYPTEGNHPRLLVTKKSLPGVIAGLKHPENRAMYEKHLALSETETDGVLPPTDGTVHNMNVSLLAVIESKAFRYLTEGEARFGYEAILAIKSFIATLSVPRGTMHDRCRAFGYAMFTAAQVYDWCYALMTDEDRAQLTAGVESRLAPSFEMGFPPLGQGGVVGHGTEAQLYRDWLSYAIACYDEYPDVYELVAGRLFATHRDAAEFYMRSGAHWQGGSYGPYRYHFLMLAQILIGAMTDGAFRLFSDRLRDVAYYLLHTVRPDGIDYPIGDGKGTISYRAAPVFLAASFYRDPALKAFAKRYLSDFTVTMNQTFATTLTPVLHLCLNDPTVVPLKDYTEALPLVLYNPSPRGQISARGSWQTKDTPAVYMKIGEAYSANHEHKDAGHFMIYYKAPLAVDSGVYNARYGCKHDCNYLKQTISHNCMLVYNPAFANTDAGGFFRFRYSGGQRLGTEAECYDLLDWARSRSIRRARIIGADHKTEGQGREQRYLWSYLAGDLSNAYDPETVECAHRYMLSVMTDDPIRPMAFFVLDRVTSVDPAFKKTFLLHTLASPEVDHSQSSASVTHGDGRLHLQSLLCDVDYEVIGGFRGALVDGKINGSDKQFWIGDTNYYAEDDPAYKIPETVEAGWGRIEISPREAKKTTVMLHAMYVTDAEDGAPALRARELRGTGVVGASLLGKTVLFPSDGLCLRETAEISIPRESAEGECLITGLSAGKWRVSVDRREILTEQVGQGRLLCFRTHGGVLEISPV